MANISELQAKIDFVQSRLDQMAEDVEDIGAVHDASAQAPYARKVSWADECVAVDANAVPGFLGSDSTNGVLRTDSTIVYADGGDYVTLSVDRDEVVGGYLDSHTQVGMPVGNDTGDMLYWDGDSWALFPKPATHAVHCFDPTDTAYGGHVWRTADADYKVLQRKEDDTIDFDWVRAHP